MNNKNRYLGCLLGLACGDAVGTSVEFQARGSFEEVTDMNGGGPFHLAPGEWTDDTSMALCMAESLIECDGFDPTDQMERYTKWLKEGYLSSTGECFDIGNTTLEAIARFGKTGEPYSGSTDPDTAGNGSIMRLAPIPMYYSPDLEKVIEYSAKSSQTTHGAKEAVDASKLFGLMTSLALQGRSKETILFDAGEILGLTDISEKIKDIALGTYKLKTRDEIRSKGYVVDTLEAALWSFYSTGSFKEAVLTVVNLGDDADTTGAVVGQIAGAYYDVEGIPDNWLDKIKYNDLIEHKAKELFNNNEID